MFVGAHVAVCQHTPVQDLLAPTRSASDPIPINREMAQFDLLVDVARTCTGHERPEIRSERQQIQLSCQESASRVRIGPVNRHTSKD